MHHLIIGYGYCGYHLAAKLLQKGEQVTAVSRSQATEYHLAELTHLPLDIEKAFQWQKKDTVLYYLIPPPAQGEHDSLLHHFLTHSKLAIRKVIYFGSSAVYGDQHGQWVDEQTTCLLSHDRQRRRLDAEHVWQSYCQQANIESVLLRVAGIYGPNRLPVLAAKLQSPVLSDTQAPWMNHIYVEDLVDIAIAFAHSTHQGIFNTADGNPQKMGTLQRLTAQLLNIPPAPQHAWQSIWDNASEMKREFMLGNKRLSIEKLRQTLAERLILTPLETAIQHSLEGTNT